MVDLQNPTSPPKQIDIGASSEPIAITPDGKRVYVADGKGLSVIDTATNTVVPVPGDEAINVRGGTLHPAQGGPAVRVGCPKKARGGCRITLQAIAKKPKRRHRKVTAETKVVRLRLGAGRSRIVPPAPKPSFMDKLAAASKVLVRERLVIGHKGRTLYRGLRLVR